MESNASSFQVTNSQNPSDAGLMNDVSQVFNDLALLSTLLFSSEFFIYIESLFE